MTTTYSLIKAAQDESATEFGRMIRRWRKANGWTQYTAKRWANEAGLGDVIRHSGLSELERGITKSPRSVVFLSLANLNALVRQGEYKGVRSRDLLDQLKGSQAICDEAGDPWGPEAFWACHAGLLAPPAWLAAPAASPAPVLTADQAAELCTSWADQAREAAKAADTGPAGLIAAGGFAPPRLRQRWSGVLLGIDSFSPQELAEQWDAEASEWKPAQWLTAWKESLIPAEPGGGGVSSELLAFWGLRIALASG
jgi:transcriptional regulator with XRE-family HTH domain